MTLTWRDIENHALYDTHSEAIFQCKVGAVTPNQVAHLLAGGVLRDDVEIDDYDEWEAAQEGDWDYADRYEGVDPDDDDDVDWTELFITIINKLAEHGERLDDLVEEQADTLDRINRVEATTRYPVFPRF